MFLNQSTTNQEEWRKEENWGGPNWGAVYFSKRDKRIFVPKRIRWMGYTVNLAHAPGVLFFDVFLMFRWLVFIHFSP